MLRSRQRHNFLEAVAREKGNIRLIPIWARDFAQVVSTLCQEEHQVWLQFASADLAGALHVIYQRVAVEFVPVEPGWFRATLLAALAGDLDAGKRWSPRTRPKLRPTDLGWTRDAQERGHDVSVRIPPLPLT